jgi:hypothetical protein
VIVVAGERRRLYQIAFMPSPLNDVSRTPSTLYRARAKSMFQRLARAFLLAHGGGRVGM